MDFSKLAELLKLLDGIIDAGASLNGALIPLGLQFLALAITLTLVNDVYQFWLRGDAQEFFSRMLRFFIVVSIPFALLWPAGAWSETNKTMIEFFQKTVTSKIAASSPSGGSPADIIKMPLKKIYDAANLAPDAESLKELDWDEKIVAKLAEFIMKIIIGLGVVAMIIAMVIVGYIPLVSLQVGAILGPLLIAWLPFEPMSDMARTWLKFMIVNAMTFVVAVLLLTLAGTAVEGLSGTIKLMFKDGAALSGLFIAAFMTLAIMVFLAYMLLQANEIASGLIGHSSVGGGFMGRAVGVAMGKAIKAAGGKASTGAGAGATAAISGGGTALTAAGNTMGQKGADMLNKGGGTLGNRMGGSVLAGAGAVSYGAGHLASKSTSVLGMGAGAAASKVGGALSGVGGAAASGAGTAAGRAVNAVVGGGQKAVDWVGKGKGK